MSQGEVSLQGEASKSLQFRFEEEDEKVVPQKAVRTKPGIPPTAIFKAPERMSNGALNALVHSEKVNIGWRPHAGKQAVLLFKNVPELVLVHFSFALRNYFVDTRPMELQIAEAFAQPKEIIITHRKSLSVRNIIGWMMRSCQGYGIPPYRVAQGKSFVVAYHDWQVAKLLKVPVFLSKVNDFLHDSLMEGYIPPREVDELLQETMTDYEKQQRAMAASARPAVMSLEELKKVPIFVQLARHVGERMVKDMQEQKEREPRENRTPSGRRPKRSHPYDVLLGTRTNPTHFGSAVGSVIGELLVEARLARMRAQRRAQAQEQASEVATITETNPDVATETATDTITDTITDTNARTTIRRRYRSKSF